MEIIFYSVFILLAFGAAIAAVLALGVGLHFDRFIGDISFRSSPS